MRLISRTAAALQPQTDELAEGLVEGIVARMDVFHDREDLVDDLRAATRQSLALVLESLRSWREPERLETPPDVLMWTRALVARGLTFETLRRVYHLGHADFQQLWHEQVAASDAPFDVIAEALGASTAFTFVWIDSTAMQLLHVYTTELERRAAGVEALRAQTVEAVLTGQLFDPVVAGGRLNYELNRSHVAFVLWLDADPPVGQSDTVDVLAREVGKSLAHGGGAPLLVRASARTAHGWVPATGIARDYVEGLKRRLCRSGARAAIGEPGHGVNGFRVSHDQAGRARRVARLLRQDAEIVLYRDVAMLDLLTRDSETARDVCADALGALAAQDVATRRLRESLRVYLDEGQSLARAARRLHVHESTVSYRVRRALELCELTDVSSHPLRAALELAPLLDEPPTEN